MNPRHIPMGETGPNNEPENDAGSEHSVRETQVNEYVWGMSRTLARTTNTWECLMIEQYVTIIKQKTGKPTPKDA